MADNTSSIAGLFMSPELYQQQRQEKFLNKAAELAQLDPSQLANVYAMQGGFGAGNALAGAMGIQDPMLQQLSARNQLASQFDTSSAEGLINLSNALRQKGDLAGASQVAQAAMAAREKEANIQAKTAERLTNEQKNAAGYADTVATRGTPEWKTAYQGKLQEMTTKEEKTKIVEANGRSLLVNSLTGELIKDLGAAPTRGTSVTVKQEGEVTKSNVQAFGDLRAGAMQASKTLETVQSLKPLISQSFAGFGADTTLKAAQIADLFGIPIKGTSETEQLRSLQNNLKIGNSTVLKGAISDKDMAILGEAIGQGSVTKAGLLGIVNNLEKGALISQKEYQLANEYQKNNKLSEYDFVEGSRKASKEVGDKIKRLRELERKAATGGQ